MDANFRPRGRYAIISAGGDAIKDKAARVLIAVSIALFTLASCLMPFKREPFYTYYFLFAWWSTIGTLDGWLYLKTGESLWIGHPVDFTCFLVPLSAFIWFVFEGFNLRLHNWAYAGVPAATAARWAGDFLAFGTVLPGLFLTAAALDYLGLFRKNDFSRFFSGPMGRTAGALCAAAGAGMLILPLLYPRLFFPLVWGGFVLLLDPLNARWGRISLLQEWRQKNWNRTLQLLLAGLICGALWESWNFWAGAKWIYRVPLPETLLKNLKVFEMPLLGFLGFPPFALECFVMAESARALRERLSKTGWRLLAGLALLYALAMCRLMDLHTVLSFR